MMNYTQDKEVKELVRLANKEGFKMKESRVVSKYDFGSTYQGTDDEESDKDMLYIYLSQIEDFLFNKNKEGSKHYDSLDARVMPLHQMYYLIQKYSVDSYLILNAQLEKGDVELNESVFKEFYNTEKYNNLVKQNLYKTVKSVYGNLRRMSNEINNKGMTGKIMVKMLTFLEVFYKLEGKEDVRYDTLSKVTTRFKNDVVPLKRYTEEDLRNVEFSNIKYFKNKGINEFEDLEEYITLEIDRCLKKSEYLKNKPECNGELYSKEELLNPLKEGVLKVYNRSYSKI